MKAFAFCAAVTLLSTAYAQDPFPNGSAGYHLDFTRIFASAEVERADRAALAREIDALQAMRGKVTADGDHLLTALQRSDDVRMKLARHAIYLYLRYAVDTRDEKSRDDGDALEADADAKRAFLRDEILALSDRRLAQLIAAQPKLETYCYDRLDPPLAAAYVVRGGGESAVGGDAGGAALAVRSLPEAACAKSRTRSLRFHAHASGVVPERLRAAAALR